MRVGIIGAGITGLALTHYLAQRDIDSITFEASPDAGGVINSREVEGKVIEVGPQRMRKTPAIAELAETAGVTDQLREGGEGDLYVYAGGSLGKAPLSPEALLKTDLLSWRAKARLLAEPLTAPGHPAESVADVFTRKFGREVYERFVGPLYGGLYGSDPARMPAAFALEGLLEREKETGSLLQAFRQRVGQGHTAPPLAVEGGNQRLLDGLATAHSERVQLETPVTAVERTNGGEVERRNGGEVERTNGGFVLHTATDRTVVDELVVTTPAGVTAELLADVAPTTSALEKLRYNPLAMVFMDAALDRGGKGYQVGYEESLHTLGVAWNPNLFGENRVHTAFLGGMHEPELVSESDDRLAAIATEEFEQVTGTPARAVEVARLKPGFPAWDDSWWLLEDVELPEGLTLATNYTARMGIPSRVREARELADEFATRTDEAANTANPPLADD